MQKTLLSLIGCLVLSGPAGAEGTANEVLSAPSRELEIYFTAMGVAFSWSNGYIRANGDTSMYCQPEKLALSGQQYVEILRDHVRDNSRAGDLPVGFAMLQALSSIFPCQDR